MGADDKSAETVPQELNNEEEEEEEEEYVVEEILKHKITKKNKVEFFLKWKGFGPEDNTWEPAENLNCPELIDAYLKDVPDKDKKKVRSIIGDVDGDKATEDEAPAQVNGNTSEEKKSKQQKRKAPDESAPKKKKKSDKRSTGFDKGLEAEEILGATETGGEVYFLIKWKGVNDAELVPSKVANIKIPQIVIKFYEARLTWSNPSDKNQEDRDENEEEGKKEETPTPQKVAAN